MLRIACLHTAQSNISVFDAALADLGVDGVMLTHHVRADLLADAEREGGLTPEIQRRTREALDALAQTADAVLLTCSTLGPSVDGHETVLRTDASLAHAAVEGGGKVVVLCAAATTLEPTRDLFEAAARAVAAAIDVRLVPGAWTAFKAGDADGYCRLIAEAVDDALRSGATTVALAQASMAGALKLMAGKPVMASPAVGLQSAIDAAARRA